MLRFLRLEEAVKFVYATTFFAESKAYLASVGRGVGEEKMAVIIQEVVGQRAGNRFYPCVSGVGPVVQLLPHRPRQARRRRRQPGPRARQNDRRRRLQLVLLARLSQGAPAVQQHRRPAQKHPDGVLGGPHGRPAAARPDPGDRAHGPPGLAEAEDDGALRYMVSTYDAGSDRLNPGFEPAGRRP